MISSSESASSKDRQSQEVEAALVRGKFREALTTKFDAFSANSPHAGLLRKQLAGLLSEINTLKNKLKTDHGADFDQIQFEAHVSGFINKLIDRVQSSLAQVTLGLSKNLDLTKLNDTEKLYTEHQRIIFRLVEILESTKYKDSLLLSVSEKMQTLVESLQRLHNLGEKINPPESPVERMSREAGEKAAKELEPNLVLAEQVLAILEQGMVLGNTNFGPLTLTYQNVTGVAINKTFTTPYHALAETTFALDLNTSYKDLEELKTKDATGFGPNTLLWKVIQERVRKIQERALGGVGSPSLAKALIEENKLTKDLVTVQAPLLTEPFDGTNDHAVTLTRLEAAKNEFAAKLLLPTVVEDPKGVFEGLKNKLLADVQELIEKVDTNQWIRTIEVTYPEIRDLRQSFEPILAGTFHYPSSVEKVRAERNKFEDKLRLAQDAVAAGAPLSDAKRTKLDTLYLNKAQRALEMIIREQTRQIEENKDYMNMPLEKLADLINGYGSGGLTIENLDSTGVGETEAGLRKAYMERIRALKLANLDVENNPDDLKKLEVKQNVILTRLDNKLNASNSIPEGNREGLTPELLNALAFEKDEFFAAVSRHPVYGRVFCEAIDNMVLQIGLKKGWQVNAGRKIEKLGTPGVPRLVYKEEYDYASAICATGGKTRLAKLADELFDASVAKQPAGQRPELLRRKAQVTDLLAKTYTGFNMLDSSLALRQRIDSQTKTHDVKSKNFAVANNLFDDLTHKINRYEKGFELSSAVYMIFFKELRQADLLGKSNDLQKFEKIKKWRKLIIEYFKIKGVSLKGVIPELDKVTTFTHDASGKQYTDSAGRPTPVTVGPIGTPEWGDEIFPSYLTVLTKTEYNDNQIWANWFKAEDGWIKFLDAVAKPVPEKVTPELIFGKGDDGLLTSLILESSVLGVAKLVKGKHYDYVAPMLTFYIQKLIANLTPPFDERIPKARVLLQIVNRLEKVSKSGLADMYPQIQKVIQNIKGDKGFSEKVDGKRVSFDSDFILADPKSLTGPIIHYMHGAELFQSDEYTAHHGAPDLMPNPFTGKATLNYLDLSTYAKSDAQKADSLETAKEINHGSIIIPYGVKEAPSQEKTTK